MRRTASRVSPRGLFLRWELQRLAHRKVLHGLLVAFFRSLWLALLLIAAALAAPFFGWSLSLDTLAVGAVIVVILTVLLALWRQPAPDRLARRLDDVFDLQELVATAHEVGDRAGVRSEVHERLLLQAHSTLRALRRHPALALPFPVREVETFLALLLVVGGLWLFTDTGSGIPPVAARRLPPPLQEPSSPFPQTVNAPGTSPEALAAMERLAEALLRNPLTRAAAEALSRGDAAGAGEALRALADRVDQLTRPERADLADTLREAAEALGSDAPQVQEALDQAADQLQNGSNAEAAEALEDLARAVETLGEQPPAPEMAAAGEQPPPETAPESGASGSEDEGAGESQGADPGAGQGNEAGDGEGGGQSQVTAPPQELGIEGVPLELDTGEDGPPTSQPSQDEDGPVGEAQSGTGFTRGGAPDPQVVETGADPLRYPWELRDTVRDYFQPAPY